MQVEPPELVMAVLDDSAGAEVLIAAEEEWGPERISAAKRHLGTNSFPEHFYFNWARKIGQLKLEAYRCTSLHWDGSCQGLMMLSLVGHVAQFGPDKGKDLVYVEFLEAAPWNVKELNPLPRFCHIGTRLLEAAVLISKDEGFEGRVGLESLMQSEGFYRQNGMQEIDPSRATRELRYFEMTKDRAEKFLEEVRD